MRFGARALGKILHVHTCRDYGNQGPLSQLSAARTLRAVTKVQQAPREGPRSREDQDRRTTPSPPREAQRPLCGCPAEGGDDAKSTHQSYVRGGLPILVIKDWDGARPDQGREDSSLFDA